MSTEDKLVKYFDGKPVTFTVGDGKLTLSMTDIGRHLGYATPRETISKLYQVHKDEFDSDCTQIVVSTTGVSVHEPPRKERVFTLDGLILICMFSEQPIAKKFRRWLRKVGNVR